MKSADDQLIDIIYDNLKNGLKYSRFYSWDYYNNQPLKYPHFHTVLSYDPVKKLWIWTNYGSSANKATKKELKWILKNIFDCTAKEFIQDYIVH